MAPKNTPDSSGVLSKNIGIALALTSFLCGAGLWVLYEKKDEGGDRSRYSSSLFVFESPSDCFSNGHYRCTENWEMASEIMDALSWGFASKDQCELSYGTYCSDWNKEWKPRMMGVAVLERNSGSFATAIPVFSSSKFPGLYLPNGYPVVSGANTINDVFRSFGVMGASKPASLSGKVCHDSAGQEICGPLSQFVSGLNADKKVLSKLF